MRRGLACSLEGEAGVRELGPRVVIGERPMDPLGM